MTVDRALLIACAIGVVDGLLLLGLALYCVTLVLQ